MKERFEQFFNWQSDKDWGWGPLLKLRPPQRMHFNRRFNFWTLFLSGCLVPVVIFLIAFIPILFLESIWRKSLVVPAFDIAGKVVDIMLEPVLRPVIFFASLMPLALLTYLWAWNRRANRIAQMPSDEIPLSQEGVWPPPPSLPRS